MAEPVMRPIEDLARNPVNVDELSDVSDMIKLVPALMALDSAGLKAVGTVNIHLQITIGGDNE